MARRTFFSFHYQADVWRAMNVRNCWIPKPTEERAEGFWDSSVFEASKRQSVDALKRFLREGLENTSVTCVLAGTHTYIRRWVRYEIARSVIRGNGILTVFIHGIRDREGASATKGPDPLDFMGFYRSGDDQKIYLCEYSGDKWIKYEDYALAIPENDLVFEAPISNTVVKLSKHYLAYDFTGQNGRDNIGGWIETAAGMVGR